MLRTIMVILYHVWRLAGEPPRIGSFTFVRGMIDVSVRVTPV
jgi:hypothetical protein